MEKIKSIFKRNITTVDFFTALVQYDDILAKNLIVRQRGTPPNLKSDRMTLSVNDDIFLQQGISNHIQIEIRSPMRKRGIAIERFMEYDDTEFVLLVEDEKYAYPIQINEFRLESTSSYSNERVVTTHYINVMLNYNFIDSIYDEY